MIKIAICDDEIKITSLIEKTLKTIFTGLRIEISIEIFYSVEKILSLIDTDNNFDLIFLDIEFKEKNGIYLAEYLRTIKNDYFTEIVFISGKKGYEKRLFDVQPLNYIKKPFTSEDIKKAVDIFLRKRIEINHRFQYIKGKNEIILLNEKDILYFESCNRKLRIVTTKGEDEFYGCLENLEEKLHGKEFVRVHRSYIINLLHATTIKHNLIIMSNEDAIPIGRSYTTIVGEKIMEVIEYD